MKTVLDVKNLHTQFDVPDGKVSAVNGISFHIDAGESLGVVGESGSGKTQIFMSIMGLLAKNGHCSGKAVVNGTQTLGLPPPRLNKIRGVSMSMIFQDPMTSLNPFMTISRQMTEVLVEHRGMKIGEARKNALQLLEQVGMPEAERRLDMYPHEFSGGMRQRVMIAMALLCEPSLLIADEPTTALDVTVQAQILDLIKKLKRETNAAIALITHDLGVVAGTCDRVMVMYGGRVVEMGNVREIFHDPKHPYTKGLLRSMPRIDRNGQDSLSAIRGQPPNLQNLPRGCAFQDRCDYRIDACFHQLPPLLELENGRLNACHLGRES